MKWRKFVSVPIFSVFLLTGFVYYVTIFFFLDNWLGFQSSAGLLNLLIFSSLGSLSFFSFLVCVLTDPGGLPPAYVPDMEENDVSDQEPKKSVSFSIISFVHCLFKTNYSDVSYFAFLFGAVIIAIGFGIN